MAKKKGKAAVVEEASEVDELRAQKPEPGDNDDNWGDFGTSKKAAGIRKGKAAAVIVEGNSKAKDSPESKPETRGRAPGLLPFETTLSPARQRIYSQLRGYPNISLGRKKSSKSSSRASSVILQPRNESSERDNASVRTSPHSWDSSSNASLGSRAKATRPRASSGSSSTSSDISAFEEGILLSASESAEYSQDSWEGVYSDEIEPSDSDSASKPQSLVQESASEGSLHVGDGNTTQQDATGSLNGTDIRTPPAYFTPRGFPRHFHPSYPPAYNFPVNTNPFTTYRPPPSPSIPAPPPSSSEELNMGSQSLFMCTLGMMLVGLDLKFFPRTFTLNGETSLLKYMNTIELSALQGPVMMIIDEWKPWYLQHLQKAFPRIPAKMLLSFHDRGVLSELPFANENRDLTCVTEHISTVSRASKAEENDHIIPIGNTQAICRSIFTWTTKDALGQRPRPQLDMDYQNPNFGKTQLHSDSTSLIVIVNGSRKAISPKIVSYYLKSDLELERWKRLADNVEWIYMDTHFLFTKWDRVWAAVKKNLQDRISESQGLKPSGSILQRTQQLHQDANTMMSLLEHLRIHQTALERFGLEISNVPEEMQLPGRYKLHQRIYRSHQLLSYYDMMANSMMGQQQNMLGLAFNVETVMQGQAVGRLNALAFIFLPMSFAASVFGMTTFTMDAKWYPALALPLLCLTVIVAIAADRILAPRQMRRPQVDQYSQSSADIESNKEVKFMTSIISRIKSAVRGTRQRKKQVQFAIPKSTLESLDSPNSDEELEKASWLTDIESSRANDLKKKLERLQESQVNESSSEIEHSIPAPRRQPSPPLYMSPSVRHRTRPGILRTESRLRSNQDRGRRRPSKKVDIDKQKPRRSEKEEKRRMAAAYQEDVDGGPVPLTADVLRRQETRNQPTRSGDSARSIGEGVSRRTQASTTYSHGASERGHVPRAFVRQTTSAARVVFHDEDYDQHRRSAVQTFDEEYMRPVPMLPNPLHRRRPSLYNTTTPLTREEENRESDVTIRIPQEPLTRALPETEATFIVDEGGVVRISSRGDARFRARSHTFHTPQDRTSHRGDNSWDAESDEAFLRRNKHKLLPSSQLGNRSTHLASLTEEGSNLGAWI